MTSLEDLSATLAIAEQFSAASGIGIRASAAAAFEVRGRLDALGIEGSAGKLAAVQSQLEEHAAAAELIRLRLEAVLTGVNALRSPASARAGATGANGVPKPTRSHGTLQKRAGIKSGPVRFSAPRKLEGKLTDEHRRQVKEYIDAANQAIEDGTLSGSGRVRPSKDPTLKVQKDAAAARERARAERAGEPYGDLVAAHLPDTTWTGTADPPGGWGRHDATVNASLGSQSDKYPEGYRPSGFELDNTWDTVDAADTTDGASQ
ncbi:hypothetical protein [Glycomyces sp. NPDC047010]|uniref:hypothetical protein n=1 Tax=Glycomyces sp. NPDC047010 TaxID=3155023 RepID=UPI00340AD3DB